MKKMVRKWKKKWWIRDSVTPWGKIAKYTSTVSLNIGERQRRMFLYTCWINDGKLLSWNRLCEWIFHNSSNQDNFLWKPPLITTEHEITLSIRLKTLKTIWRPPRKSGLTPKIAKARVVRYAIVQSPQWFLELTHSSSDASNYFYSLQKY